MNAALLAMLLLFGVFVQTGHVHHWPSLEERSAAVRGTGGGVVYDADGWVVRGTDLGDVDGAVREATMYEGQLTTPSGNSYSHTHTQELEQSHLLCPICLLQIHFQTPEISTLAVISGFDSYAQPRNDVSLSARQIGIARGRAPPFS